MIRNLAERACAACPEAPAWRQILLLLLGTWMALCGGSLYAFSRFEVQIMSRCGLTAQQLDVVYAAGQAGVGLGIIPGTLYDLRGPVGACLYGAVFNAAGNFGMSLMLQREGCGGVSTLAFWYFLVQQGSVAIFQAGLFSNIANAPPKMQGVITGIVSSGYGLSAAFVTLLFAFFGEDTTPTDRCPPDNCGAFASAAGCFFLRSDESDPGPTDEDLDQYFKGTGVLFAITGLVAAALMPCLHGKPRLAYGRLPEVTGKDEAGVSPPPTKLGRQEESEELERAAPATPSSKSVPHMSRKDILCRLDFWLFLMSFVLLQAIGSGLYIANLSLIGDSLGISADHRAIYVRAVSYSNCLGRLCVGFAMDALEIRGVHRSDHIVVTAVGVMLSSFALLLLPEEVVPHALLPALAVTAAAYGANWAIMPSFIAKRFQGSHVGVMFNVHSGHIAVAVLLTSYAVGGLYDIEAAQQGQDAFCRGAICWRSSFALGAGLQTLALLVGLVLAWSVRRCGGDMHRTQPLHRILRKFDLILSAQMRWFVQMSLTDWVAFVRSFMPKDDEPLQRSWPVTSAIMSIEYEMLEVGILEHIDILERISVKAQKEHGLKTALALMKKEWRPIEFGLVPHRSGTHMVKGIDEIQAVLDDHIVKTMGIRGSPFVEPIEKEVKDTKGNVEKWLMEVQGSMIDSLTKVTASSLLAYAKNERSDLGGPSAVEGVGTRGARASALYGAFFMATEASDVDDLVDVCIIGAGLAALTAAERRLRGRDFCGRWVEEGANWVQGLGQNPIWRRVQERGLQGRLEEDDAEVEGRMQLRGLGAAGPEDLTKEALKRFKAFEEAMDRVEEGDSDGEDLDLAHALAEGGWTPKDAMDLAVEYVEVDFEYGESSKTISVKHNVHGEYTWEDFSPDSFFVDDPKGLSSICSVPTGWTGVAGTAYVHVIHREPSGKLLPLLEEHLTLLTSRKSLTPRAIANFINLLYGSSSEHQPSQTLSHLRLEAAGTLSSFAATELLDVASGLAKCQQLDCNFLQDLRRAVDSMPFEPPPSPEHPWDVADPSKTWRCPQPPRLLADFPDALVLSKPAGWSCATGRASRATGGDGRGGPAPARVAEVLAASFPELSPFQDAAADHGMAHRLDLETSGALLLGKSLRSFWRLRLEFVAQKVKRQYLTLVQGRLGPLGVAQQVQEPLRLQRLRRSNPTRSVQSKSLVCETGRPLGGGDPTARPSAGQVSRWIPSIQPCGALHCESGSPQCWRSSTMCNYTKTFVKLESALWVHDEHYIVRVGKPCGRHAVWQPLAPDMAIVTNTGDEGRRVEQLTEEEGEMYQSFPKIIQAEATRWSSDPLFRGSYSFLPTGSMPEGWEVINQRHGRLFFAGEAFHPRWSGYMQGTKWVLEWPGQVVICIDNIFWTQEVAAAIESGKLEEYHKKTQDQLAGLVNLVRGELPKLGRQTLGALVTIDVHNRDVVQNLKEAKISSSKEFDWIAQLRYYWRQKGSITLKDTGKASTVDKCEACTTFNRINLEVLSVVSQQACRVSCPDACVSSMCSEHCQVQTIQFAIRDKKDIFYFEDTQIRLIPSCAVNITMNPGYAGRSELPDNLKALFRPCAMMVPDYALIGEIHYDFGMRALKSILVRAGALRRQYGSSRAEQELALSALNDVNLPKFTRNDIPLFLGITGDLFPEVELPPSDYGVLIDELEGSARSLVLQPQQGFIKKCIQLWETIMVRHGLMLVGQTVSGKTEVENVLAAALAAVADGENYLPVQIHKINPKSIKQGQLYGENDEGTQEWTDGILALTVRFASSAELTKRQWILLDGPVDAVWVENLNTVLDDNKKLCLNSGEIIKLTPVTTMMFEVEDLSAASPATVSRCGMVFLEQLDIGWHVLMLTWCERLPDRLKDQSAMLQEVMEFSVDCCWEMVSRKVNKPVPVSLNWLVLNLLHLYWALIQERPNTWELWSKKIGSFEIPKDAEAHSLIIPTSDTARNAFLLQTMIKAEFHVLFAGPTGTGKTIVVQQQLLKGLDREKYSTFAFAFSAQSSANQTQEMLHFSLATSTSNDPGLVGTCADLTAASKLLRQWMDTSGWYERKTCEFRQLVDLNFIAAMTPSAGRPQITARYQRHYNYFYLLPFQGESLQRIFQTIMQWFLGKFPSQVSGLSGTVVRATPIIFVDFADSKALYYQQVTNLEQLDDVLKNRLMDYNSMAKRSMELVLFTSAAQHICRIVRVLKTPLGNALLVGVGGSGRKSLATLGTFVAEYDHFSIEITKKYSVDDWHEDIKRLLMSVGGGTQEAPVQVEHDPLTGGHYRVSCPSTERAWIGLRGRPGVVSGQYCFEVKVTEGLLRVGWATGSSATKALGTDAESFGFGGTGKKSHRNKFADYGASFEAGDVVTCCVDRQRREISFGINGMWHGKAFDIPKAWDGFALFPALCAREAFKATGYFGCPEHPKVPHGCDFWPLGAAFPEDVEESLAGPPQPELNTLEAAPERRGARAGRFAKMARVDQDLKVLSRYPRDAAKLQDPEQIRPLPVLREALQHALSAKRAWSWEAEMLRAIRQDITVQHLDADFMEEVCEISCLRALANGDWPVFASCATTLKNRPCAEDLVLLSRRSTTATKAFETPKSRSLTNPSYSPLTRSLALKQRGAFPESAVASAKGRLATPVARFVKSVLSDINAGMWWRVLQRKPPTVTSEQAFELVIRPMASAQVLCAGSKAFMKVKQETLVRMGARLPDGVQVVDGLVDGKQALPLALDQLRSAQRGASREDHSGEFLRICVQMQESVFGLTDRFRREVQRHYYVTPTSYLELINSFKDVLASKRDEVSSAKRRYDDGLEKVISTEEQVKTMSIQLEELRPVLKQTSAETAELMTVIEHKQEEASATQAMVAKEEEAASQQAEAARTMKEECQADLDKALPALNAALDALKSLKKSDIVEVKNMKSPPEGVITVSKALCWMFDVKPKKVTAEDGRTKIDDYWEPSKKSLWGDSKMLDRLLGYDKDHIPVEVIEKLKPLEEDPEFDPEVIRKASTAAMGICKWVRAMIVYDGVAKVVGPKKEALAGAEQELAKVMSILAEKKAELKADNVAQLLADFESARKKKDDLAVQVDDCSKRLVRAEKLISGLGGEKTRWMDSSKRLGEQYTNLTGDVLIGSGIIAYLGTFTGRYRVDTVRSWVQLMKDNQLPSAQEFSLRSVLGDEVQIRQWVIDKLPNDQVSVENAIIIQRSRRWPLMIDPQLQANQWIRKACSGRGEQLRILRLTQNYARELEGAIAYGKPCLLENVLEQLDPLLEPLLQKAIFKAGSVMMIRLGDSQCEYNKDFRFYITTKLPNPHYSPEVCVQVTLLNFMATPDGLQDQMLGILVAKEAPEVERKRQNLIVESAQSKAQLKEIEDWQTELYSLHACHAESLSRSKGNILDDEELINTLATSKTASLRIEERVAEQDAPRCGAIAPSRRWLASTRATYVPVAVRASALFFVVADLCNVEPMYQYSLEWFYTIYEAAIAAAEKFERNIQKRLSALQSKFLELLFERGTQGMSPMAQVLKTKDQVMVEVIAEDEDSRRYTWKHPLPLQQKIMPLRRHWAEAHGVEEEAVLFLDHADASIDLQKTPAELGWKDTVQLCAVPASDDWAEGAQRPPKRPPRPAKRAKVEKTESQSPSEKASSSDLGGNIPGDDEPVVFQADNPKRSGTTAYERYEKYKSAKTITEALEKGAARGDIINDFKKGFFGRQ
eukprot:g18849.t2